MQQVTEIIFFIFTNRKKRYITGDAGTGHRKSGSKIRVIKENSDIFGEFLLCSFNDTVDKCYALICSTSPNL